MHMDAIGTNTTSAPTTPTSSPKALVPDLDALARIPLGPTGAEKERAQADRLEMDRINGALKATPDEGKEDIDRLNEALIDLQA